MSALAQVGIERGQMMILRTAILGAMVICTASLAMADETLYCADTAVVGFKWDEGKVATTTFSPHRYKVKVISDTEFHIVEIKGAGAPSLSDRVSVAVFTYTCHSLGHYGRIACDGLGGGDPWVFYGNNYTHAFLTGTPVGPPNSTDPNISVAYGTCTHF
jgi:hypothetical protein